MINIIYSVLICCMFHAGYRPIVAEENMSVTIYANGSYHMFSQDDIDLMARVVMSEASTQSDECKEAVATTILNRWASPDYSDFISVIVEDAYSTADNGAVTDECYLAVYSAIAFWGGDYAVLPKQVYYFRADHYHEWALNYKQIDDLYFSAPVDACFN